MYNSKTVILYIFVNPLLQPRYNTSLSPQKVSLGFLPVILHQRQPSHLFLSLYVSFDYLWIFTQVEWYSTSFAQYVFKIHLCCISRSFVFFFFQSNILLYEYTEICFCKFHSTVDGHLSCFKFSVIMNIVAKRISIQVFCKDIYFVFFVGKYLGKKFLTHKVDMYLTS